MDRAYALRNTASRERLRQLLTRLGDAATRYPTHDGWAVSVVLAHPAFWDRFVLERRRQAEIAAREALEAATAVDGKIARLSPAAAEAILASGRHALLDRDVHRGPHLDKIERALRREAPG